MNDVIVKQDEELLFEPKNLTKDTIKKYLCPLATDQELTMGLAVAKTCNLNPLKQEVYFVKYSTKDPMQVLTGYEVYLKRAERSGKYAGLESSTEGNIKDGTLKAIVKVYRKDWERPLIHETYYDEYVAMKNVYEDGKYKGKEPTTFWKNKPRTMIKKVAISQAFRLAFPDEFDGMPYTRDEINTIDVEVEPKVEIKTEALDMPKPRVLETPKTPPTSKVQVETVKQVVEEKKIDAAPAAPEQQGIETETVEVPTVSKEEFMKLCEKAVKNGHTVDDITRYVKGLGYKSPKRCTLWDWGTVVEHFSKPKLKEESESIDEQFDSKS